MIQATEAIAEKEKRLVIAAQAGDRQAVADLIEMHKRFVWKLARKTKCRHLETEDLVQIGTMAFIRCIARFDVNRGVRLLTFCGHGIARSMWGSARRWNAPESVSLDCEGAPVLSCQADLPEAVASRREIAELIGRALEHVRPRECDIVRRRLRGQTLAEISVELGISKERVRQLESRAKDRLIEAGVRP